MLKRECHKVLHPLEPGIALTVADPLSDDNFHPSKILSCIGPDLLEHLCVERREAHLITGVGFVDVYTSVSMKVPSYSIGAVREVVSSVFNVSAKQISTLSGSPIT